MEEIVKERLSIDCKECISPAALVVALRYEIDLAYSKARLESFGCNLRVAESVMPGGEFDICYRLDFIGKADQTLLKDGKDLINSLEM